MKNRYLSLLLIVTFPFFGQAPGSIVEEPIDPYLSSPMDGAIKEMPVLVLRYLPTVDGINLDVNQVPDYWSLGYITLEAMKNNLTTLDKRLKFSLEEGSRFRGYANPSAVPYLGYKVARCITIYRQVYISNYSVGSDNGIPLYQPDYKAEWDELHLLDYINQNNIKEVWLWYGGSPVPSYPSYDPVLHGGITKHVGGVESNMASPTSPDISNSYRYSNDMYIANHTYTVYGNSIRRSQAEAVHNHGHQLERLYGNANFRQSGDTNLFNQQFCGYNSNLQNPLGRAGDTHHPPNTTVDYDYLNTTLVLSDIEDWKPTGGQATLINKDRWESLQYDWPGDTDFSQKTESQWYIYWFQNMPGYQNSIPYSGNAMMTNWWQFTSDWDRAYTENIGLYGRNLGLENHPAVNDIKVFPNPAKDHVTVNTVGLASKSTCVLFAMNGQKLLETSLDQKVSYIDVSQIPNGIYVLKVYTAGASFVTKLLIYK